MTPASPTPFDLDAASKTVTGALLSYMKFSFAAPAERNEADVRQMLDDLQNALIAGSAACAEVDRLRGELSRLRDQHRPRPHADSSAPGALCEACSLHGALIGWPCQTWTAADRTLTHGQH